jgi:hypothetical protein
MEWAHEELARRSIATTGEALLVHDRPWSQVIRIPTDRGAVFCKTVIPALGYEVPVTASLARWMPDRVTQVIAADPGRRLLLMEDAGERFRMRIERDHDVTAWQGILPRYAELQIAMAHRANEFVAMGAPDRRASALAVAFEAVVNTDELLTIAGPQSTTTQDLAALRALIPRVREACVELGGTIPDTIQHDDLHDGQVFIQDGVVRFLDWGDSNVSHPFFTLVVFQRHIAHFLGCDEHDARVTRLRDEYLEPFTGAVPRARIDACLPIALRLGRLCRALTWADLVRVLPPEDRDREMVPGWFQVFLESMHEEVRR